jgi:hypothetical protein
MNQHAPRFLEFVYAPLFEQTAAGVLDADELAELEQVLVENPRAGSVERGTGGVRKLRVPTRGSGKRGGARVVYLYVERASRVYLLLAYPKPRKAGLTSAERRAMRTLAHELKREHEGDG